MKNLMEILQEFEDKTRQEERDSIKDGVKKLLREKYGVELSEEDWRLIVQSQ